MTHRTRTSDAEELCLREVSRQQSSGTREGRGENKEPESEEAMVTGDSEKDWKEIATRVLREAEGSWKSQANRRLRSAGRGCDPPEGETTLTPHQGVARSRPRWFSRRRSVEDKRHI
jgi:hypothetical protein